MYLMTKNGVFVIPLLNSEHYIHQVSWIPPKHGWIKFNINGSSLGNPI